MAEQVKNALRILHQSHYDARASNIARLIVEPNVWFCGGYLPPQGYLQRLREIW